MPAYARYRIVGPGSHRRGDFQITLIPQLVISSKLIRFIIGQVTFMMTRFPIPRGLVLMAGVAVMIVVLDSVAAAPAQTSRTLNKTDIDRWMTEISNWGRWGKADQAGTVNLITPEKRKAAAQLVHEGFSVSLARDADKLRGRTIPSPGVTQ